MTRLETSRRRQGALNAVLGCALLATLVAGLATPEDGVLRATRFVVVDAGGAERATLGILDGRIALVFEDENGDVQAGFGLSSGTVEEMVPEGYPLLFLGPPANPFAQLAIMQDPLEEAETIPSFRLGRPEPKRNVVLQAQSGREGATLSFQALGVGGPWGVSSPISLIATRSGPSVIQVRDARGDLQFSTDPNEQEYEGSSHFPVNGDDGARTAISARPAPRFVQCRGKGVTDDTLRILSKGRGFVEVALRSCPQVSSEGLRALARVQGMRHLYLADCRGLAAADFSQLAPARQLESLGLIGIPVGGEQVRDLASLTQLEELVISAGWGGEPRSLEDESSLLSLAALEGLVTLDLSAFGPLGEETVTALREALPETEISFAP